MTDRNPENVQYFSGGSWTSQAETHYEPGDPHAVDRDGKQVPGPISHMTWVTPSGQEMVTPATTTLGPGDDWGTDDAYMVVKSLEDGRQCVRIAGYQVGVADPPKEVWTICQRYEAWREIR